MNQPQSAQETSGRIGLGTRTRVYGAVALVVVVLVAAYALRSHSASSSNTSSSDDTSSATHDSASNRSSNGSSSNGSSSQPSRTSAEQTAPHTRTTVGSAAINPPLSISPSNADSTGLTLLGVVQTETRSLSVLQPARIVAVMVHDGDRVRQGQLLIRLDGAQGQVQERTATAGVTEAQAQLGKARAGREAQRVKVDADVQTAQAGFNEAQDKLHKAILGLDTARAAEQAELAQARASVRKAQAGLEQAQQTLHSLEDLSTVGGVARNELNDAKTQVSTAQSDLEQAQTQVKRLQDGPSPGVSYRVALAQQDVKAAHTGVEQAHEGVTTAHQARKEALAVAAREIQVAAAGLEQAQAGAAGARNAAQLTLLTSPQAGIATGLTAHAGETAQPGAPLVSIVGTSAYRIEALATARQLAGLHVGQRAVVTLDTQPGVALPGQIFAISRVAEPDGRSFRIKLRLLRPPADLRPGQSARITFAAP